MDKKHCPKHRPLPPTPPGPPYCEVEDRIMAYINRRFATNEAVSKLANEIRAVNDNLNIKASEMATVAAGLVLRQVRVDLDDMRNQINEKTEFKVELVPTMDDGKPLVTEPDFTTMYLTASDHPEEGNQWDEWMAIKDPQAINGYKWEHLGAKTIDLSWVGHNFEEINKQIHKLQCKIGKFSKEVADTILNRAVKPLNELKAYLKSPEFMQLLISNAGIPLASATNNGLMSSQSYALLYAISNWITYDTEIEGLGGGSYGEREVNRLWSQG